MKKEKALWSIALLGLMIGLSCQTASAEEALKQCPQAHINNPTKQCTTTEAMVQKLTQKYGESARSRGLTPDGRLIQTYSNPESGSWSIILTKANGMSCFLTGGVEYDQFEEEGLLKSGGLQVDKKTNKITSAFMFESNPEKNDWKLIFYPSFRGEACISGEGTDFSLIKEVNIIPSKGV